MNDRTERWMEAKRSNAVAVEKPLEARLGKGMGRRMGEGAIKAGIARSRSLRSFVQFEVIPLILSPSWLQMN